MVVHSVGPGPVEESKDLDATRAHWQPFFHTQLGRSTDRDRSLPLGTPGQRSGEENHDRQWRTRSRREGQFESRLWETDTV